MKTEYLQTFRFFEEVLKKIFPYSKTYVTGCEKFYEGVEILINVK